MLWYFKKLALLNAFHLLPYYLLGIVFLINLKHTKAKQYMGIGPVKAFGTVYNTNCLLVKIDVAIDLFVPFCCLPVSECKISPPVWTIQLSVMYLISFIVLTLCEINLCSTGHAVCFVWYTIVFCLLHCCYTTMQFVM